MCNVIYNVQNIAFPGSDEHPGFHVIVYREIEWPWLTSIEYCGSTL
jgi:hypothetical protein